MLGVLNVLMNRNFVEDQKRLGKGQDVEEEEQGRPQQDEDRSLTRLRFYLGYQDRSALKWMPGIHPDSDSDELDMVGKIRRLSDQPNWYHFKFHPDSTGIVETSQRSDSVWCCDTVYWVVCRVGAH
jgi:hypothetical protein